MPDQCGVGIEVQRCVEAVRRVPLITPEVPQEEDRPLQRPGARRRCRSLTAWRRASGARCLEVAGGHRAAEAHAEARHPPAAEARVAPVCEHGHRMHHLCPLREAEHAVVRHSGRIQLLSYPRCGDLHLSPVIRTVAVPIPVVAPPLPACVPARGLKEGRVQATALDVDPGWHGRASCATSCCNKQSALKLLAQPLSMPAVSVKAQEPQRW
mmetsp:Transcript_16573/g.33532  ORF Transcript_16573/g.33532 Transcript_16573/m.33532 type:complete len:211 (+) Transcript_16573:202-834(+)